MMYYREKAICWNAFIPLLPNLPQSPAANCGAVPALTDMESESWLLAVAKLGGTAELFGPFWGSGWLFLIS